MISYQVLPNYQSVSWASYMDSMKGKRRGGTKGTNPFDTYIFKSKKAISAIFLHRASMLQHLFQRCEVGRRLLPLFGGSILMGHGWRLYMQRHFVSGEGILLGAKNGKKVQRYSGDCKMVSMSAATRVEDVPSWRS